MLARLGIHPHQLAVSRFVQRIETKLSAGNLLGPAEGRQKVARGGSWDENRPNLRLSFRNVKPPAQNGAIYGSIGFRCAQDM